VVFEKVGREYAAWMRSGARKAGGSGTKVVPGGRCYKKRENVVAANKQNSFGRLG